MSVTPREARLIRESWRGIAHERDAMVATFYETLFRWKPVLRDYFREDMSEQRRMLAVTLNLAVSHVDRLGAIRDAVRELGRRHAHYGARGPDYELVVEALLRAIGQHAGPVVFSARVESAWRRAFALITEEMQAGAEAREPRFSAT